MGGKQTETVAVLDRADHHLLAIRPGWTWLRVELEEAGGGTAWGNPVFVSDLSAQH